MWRWPLPCSLWRRCRCRRVDVCQGCRVAGYEESPHLWCGRKGCGSVKARVTIMHALKVHCQAKMPVSFMTDNVMQYRWAEYHYRIFLDSAHLYRRGAAGFEAAAATFVCRPQRRYPAASCRFISYSLSRRRPNQLLSCPSVICSVTRQAAMSRDVDCLVYTISRRRNYHKNNNNDEKTASQTSYDAVQNIIEKSCAGEILQTSCGVGL